MPVTTLPALRIVLERHSTEVPTSAGIDITDRCYQIDVREVPNACYEAEIRTVLPIVDLLGWCLIIGSLSYEIVGQHIERARTVGSDTAGFVTDHVLRGLRQ